MKLVLLSNSTKEPTAKMLQAGLRARDKVLVGGASLSAPDVIDVEEATFDELVGLMEKTDGSVAAAHPGAGISPFATLMARRGGFDPSATVVVVLVSEPALSCVSNGSREPCQSLKTAQAVLATHPGIRLYLVVKSDHSTFTGIDALTALLFGVAGIIEERALVEEDIIQEVLEHRVAERYSRSMLVFGHMLDRIRELKAMIEEWDNDFNADPRLELAYWKASLALAQLDRVEPIFSSGVSTFSFVKLAQALNLVAQTTGFSLTQNDLRRALSVLTLWWLNADHEPVERTQLPAYARQHGFPRHLPVIQEVTDAELMRLLYYAAKNSDITDDKQVGYGVRCHVRLRMNEFPHVLRNRFAQVSRPTRPSKEDTNVRTH